MSVETESASAEVDCDIDPGASDESSCSGSASTSTLTLTNTNGELDAYFLVEYSINGGTSYLEKVGNQIVSANGSATLTQSVSEGFTISNNNYNGAINLHLQAVLLVEAIQH